MKITVEHQPFYIIFMAQFCLRLQQFPTVANRNICFNWIHYHFDSEKNIWTIPRKTTQFRVLFHLFIRRRKNSKNRKFACSKGSCLLTIIRWAKCSDVGAEVVSIIFINDLFVLQSKELIINCSIFIEPLLHLHQVKQASEFALSILFCLITK